MSAATLNALVSVEKKGKEERKMGRVTICNGQGADSPGSIAREKEQSAWIKEVSYATV